MYEELEYEFAEFKKDIDGGSLQVGQYFDEYEYENEYSHNEIHKFQSKFIGKAKKYLRENYPNKYIIMCGFCVFVMTIEEAKKRKLFQYESLIVK